MARPALSRPKLYEWDRSPGLSLSRMQDLVREQYLGKRFIFFGRSMGRLVGVPDTRVLQGFTNREYMIHEPLERLPEVEKFVSWPR